MKPKKYLGQNFLTRDHYAKVMCEAAGVSNKDVVVEVGPGKGILTRALLERAGRVVAIEKDPELISFLKEIFREEIDRGKLKIIEEDIRNFVPSRLTLHASRYKVVANIPYYITGEIVRHFLSTKRQPTSLTLMVQKEVAERIVAKDGKESLLSLSVKAYGEPKIIARVGAGNFYPKPKVDSAILQVGNISRKFFDGLNEKNFFEVLHAGFAHKRKVLLGNLKSAGYSEEKLKKTFAKEKISPTARAENITLSTWKKIAEGS